MLLSLGYRVWSSDGMGWDRMGYIRGARPARSYEEPESFVKSI